MTALTDRQQSALYFSRKRRRLVREIPIEDQIASLFANDEQGTWLDPSDSSTMFQDAAGTIPAGIAEPVRLALDKSGNGNHALAPSDAARPVYGREPATGRRNMLPNNRLDGAAVGVVGSGGALPSGWSASIAVDSLEVLEISERDGFPLIKLRMISDNTGGSGTIFARINFASSTAVTYSTDDTWTASLFASEISRVGKAARLFLIAGSSTGSFVALFASVSIPTSYQRVAISGSTSNIEAETVRTEIGADLAVGEAIDITFEIAVPQLEQSATATAVQITGAGGFDVTEAGVRELRYLQSNGVDTVLNFPSGILVYGPSEAWLGYRYEAGTEFVAGFRNGGGGVSENRFQVGHDRVDFGAAGTIINPRDTDENYVIGGSVAGTGTTTQTAFRVGSTPVTEAVTRAGVEGNLNLFSAFSSFAQMRFYGGIVMGDRVLTEKERDFVQRYLAQKSGVVYP